MRKALRWLSGLFALLGVVVALLLIIANTATGRRGIERAAARLSGDEVRLSGITGRVPDRFRIRSIALGDRHGVWLRIEDLRIDWSPAHLFAGRADITRLSARGVTIERLPEPDREEGESTTELPVSLMLRKFRIGRLELGPTVLGADARMLAAAEGSLRFRSVADTEFTLHAWRLDAPDAYRLRIKRETTGSNDVTLDVHESRGGVLARLAGLPDLGPIAASASASGPDSALSVAVDAGLGPLRAKGQGRLDVPGRGGHLLVSVNSPEMHPAPGLAWRSLSIETSLSGALERPQGTGTLRISQLRFEDSAIDRIVAEFSGDPKAITLSGTLGGLILPPPIGGLLGKEPIDLRAEMQPDTPGLPVTISLSHSLITAKARLASSAPARGELDLNVPDLGPWAGSAGLDLRGPLGAMVRFEDGAAGLGLGLEGQLDLKSGAEPLPALLGRQARISGATRVDGGALRDTRIDMNGEHLRLSANGTIDTKGTDLNWTMVLPDLARAHPLVKGQLKAHGRISGPLDRLAAQTDLSGAIGTRDVAPAPLNGHLIVDGLPTSPVGELRLDGRLDGSPLRIRVAAKPVDAETTRLDITELSWAGLSAGGSALIPHDGTLPSGRLNFRAEHLAALKRVPGLETLDGQLSGSLAASAAHGQHAMRVELRGDELRWGKDLATDSLTLSTSIDDPLGSGAISGELRTGGLHAGGTAWNGISRFDGTLARLRIDLGADSADLGGAPARLAASATLDTGQDDIELRALSATWRGEELRLSTPMHLRYRQGLELSPTVVHLRDGRIALSGRLAPHMDLQMDAQAVPIGVATDAATGRLSANARLSGEPSRPEGNVHVGIADLRVRATAGAALPPAQTRLDARLADGRADINGRFDVGKAGSIALSGELPLTANGILALRAEGKADLSALDPLLTPAGRSLRGQFEFTTRIDGSTREPALHGTARLARGEFRDYRLGVHLADISASLRADGDTIWLERLDGKSGTGRIGVSGEFSPVKAGRPIDMRIRATHARPLATDRLTAEVSSDLRVHGHAVERLTAEGTVRIHRADIRIPERLPARIAVLDIRKPGEIATSKPPAAPSAGLVVALDVHVDAPSSIFVRGRGIDTEMSGRIHLLGTVNAPEPIGSFTMRRGELQIAGRSINFTRGSVGFEGGELTDPSLDFLASATSSSISASLSVEGTARKPRIMLTSTPERPQDEILAQLLFGRSSSSLGPLELAQIAAGIASLTGMSSSITDPLGRVRATLGLDRLAIGSATTGGPTLEGGRYIAPGIYLGGRQSIAGAGTQATVQVDVAEGLKLEGSVGTAAATSPSASRASGTTAVGVIYQFEY